MLADAHSEYPIAIWAKNQLPQENECATISQATMLPVWADAANLA